MTMKMHGRNGWTAKRRMEIAADILADAYDEIGNGRDIHAADLIRKARQVLVLNPDFLDRKVKEYQMWMKKGPNEQVLPQLRKPAASAGRKRKPE